MFGYGLILTVLQFKESVVVCFKCFNLTFKDNIIRNITVLGYYSHICASQLLGQHQRSSVVPNLSAFNVVYFINNLLSYMPFTIISFCAVVHYNCVLCIYENDYRVFMYLRSITISSSNIHSDLYIY